MLDLISEFKKGWRRADARSQTLQSYGLSLLVLGLVLGLGFFQQLNDTQFLFKLSNLALTTYLKSRSMTVFRPSR